MGAPVFISYKSEEEPYARQIRSVLEQNGISCQGETAYLGMYLYYDKDLDAIAVDYGGANESNPAITLYGVLDVDDPPSSIRFTSPDAFPLIDDTCRIETVIIPTKSCEARVRGSYQIAGTEYQTEEYRVNVQVPYFEDRAIITGGALTRELMHTNLKDSVQRNRVLEKYRYDVQSILPADVLRG